MATETVSNPPAPVEQVVRELRTIRGYALKCAGALDAAGQSEAVHYLRTALTSLDDCLDRLEKPDADCSCGTAPSGWSMIDRDCPVHGIASEQLTSHMDDVFVRPDTIADDRRDDLMADADRSEYR